MSLLAAHNLSLTLSGRPVLRSVDMAAAAGEVLALIGPNGAGKTSLLRCLAGLVAPGDGEARFDGKPIAAISMPERARRLAFLPQESAVHWPVAVYDLVMLGRSPFRRNVFAPPGPADIAAVGRALAQGGLTELADRPSTGLSGGELRRALLARALAGAPEALLADEPTAGLDPGSGLDVMAALRRAAADGAAIVVASHDLALAGRFADRVVLLHEGAVAAAGAPAAVLTADNLARCYGVRPAKGDVFRLGPLERVDDRGDVAGD